MHPIFVWMNATLKVEREGKLLESVETQTCWFSAHDLLSLGLKPLIRVHVKKV